MLPMLFEHRNITLLSVLCHVSSSNGCSLVAYQDVTVYSIIVTIATTLN